MARWTNENAYDEEIEAARQSFDVPASVIKAVIATESAFNPRAFRAEPQINDGSAGLMQLLLKTARGLGYFGTVQGLYDPATNIYYGTKLLHDLYRQTGSWSDTFSAYNGGMRPEIGFGARATRSVRVCLARDRSGTCTDWHVVPVGEYANQAYVDKINRNVTYFSTGQTIQFGKVVLQPRPSRPVGTGVSAGPVAALLGLGALALLGGRR